MAYPVSAATVLPGELSVTEATLEIKDVIRDKKDIGRGKPVCLVFLALDHQGKLHLTTVFVGVLFVYADTSGYRPSSKLRSLVDLMSNGR